MYSLIWLYVICNTNSFYNFHNLTKENHVVNCYTCIYIALHNTVHIQLQSQNSFPELDTLYVDLLC